MKHTYSFLSGVALISLCVVGTRSLPGYMFLLGFCVSSLSIALLGRAIGASRIARFFLRLCKSNYPSPSLNPISGQSKEARVADGARSVTRDRRELRRMPGAHNDLPAKEIRMRRNPSSAQNKNSRGVVNSGDVLPQVQQDVLSALMNLKVPFPDAEQAVLGAAQRNAGASFDEMFRIALALVQAGAGKSRRVA